jgi:hypothetical protein
MTWRDAALMHGEGRQLSAGIVFLRFFLRIDLVQIIIVFLFL